jgi:uncharacterized protein YecE (DUF72 family)
MANILIGTTSWTDKTLIASGLFYPRDVKTAEARLRYYANQFPIVEVDSSYYAMPAERNSMLWVERTPAAFTFDIKAFRLFTQHQTPLSALPGDIRAALGEINKANVYYRDLGDELIDEMWERFRAAIAPLARAGKLGVVVFQFPPWFVFRRSNSDHILQCAQRLDGYQIAVEFRNISWLGDRHRQDVLAFEKENRLVHVVVDEPQGFSGSIPAVWEVTCPEVAAVRLHGRNRATWEKKGLTAAERFNYLYSDEELKEFVGPVRTLAAHARRVHVLFNNCYGNNAQRNATELQRLID